MPPVGDATDSSWHRVALQVQLRSQIRAGGVSTSWKLQRGGYHTAEASALGHGVRHRSPAEDAAESHLICPLAVSVKADSGE